MVFIKDEQWPRSPRLAGPAPLATQANGNAVCNIPETQGLIGERGGGAKDSAAILFQSDFSVPENVLYSVAYLQLIEIHEREATTGGGGECEATTRGGGERQGRLRAGNATCLFLLCVYVCVAYLVLLWLFSSCDVPVFPRVAAETSAARAPNANEPGRSFPLKTVALLSVLRPLVILLHSEMTSNQQI